MTSSQTLPQRRTARLALSGGLAVALLATVAPDTSAAETTKARSTGATTSKADAKRPPWPTLLTFDTSLYRATTLATSRSKVAVIALTPYADDPKRKTRLIRVMPNGHVDRTQVRLGVYPVLGLDVDPRGNTTAVGQVHGDIVAATWARGAKRPSRQTLATKAQLPGFVSAEMHANVSGDILVSAAYGGNRQRIMRLSSTGKAKRAVVVGPARYGAKLADVAIRSNGGVIGAFLGKHKVSNRAMAPSSRRFGPARVKVRWPGLSGIPAGAVELATVTTGPSNAVLTTLSYLEAGQVESTKYRFKVDSASGDWRGSYTPTNHWDEFGTPVLAANGSFTLNRPRFLTYLYKDVKRTSRAYVKAIGDDNQIVAGDRPWRGRWGGFVRGKRTHPTIHFPIVDYRNGALTPQGIAFAVTYVGKDFTFALKRTNLSRYLP